MVSTHGIEIFRLSFEQRLGRFLAKWSRGCFFLLFVDGYCIHFCFILDNWFSKYDSLLNFYVLFLKIMGNVEDFHFSRLVRYFLLMDQWHARRSQYLIGLIGYVERYIYIYMGVSENDGTPKSSILIWVSIINHPFWGTFIFGNTHIYIYIQHTHTLSDSVVFWSEEKLQVFEDLSCFGAHLLVGPFGQHGLTLHRYADATTLRLPTEESQTAKVWFGLLAALDANGKKCDLQSVLLSRQGRFSRGGDKQ